ncbi:unnamed protein product, partial [Gulo gulo]
WLCGAAWGVAGEPGVTCPLCPQAAGTLPAAAAAPWPAGPCSAAWPSCGRRGSGGGSSSPSIACTTTASAGATTASAAPTSMTPTKWPCVPGALRP